MTNVTRKGVDERARGGLRFQWSVVPWDSRVFGAPVLQIHEIAYQEDAAGDVLPLFETERDRLGAMIVSCRMPASRLQESMILEAHGFRFIEMMLEPSREGLTELHLAPDPSLTVAHAEHADMPALLEIAGTAFRNERYHVDPRLDPQKGNERYQQWVANALEHPSQRLIAVRDGRHIIAFFLVEMLSEGTCYWHLNAIAPPWQGRGYGRRVWSTMLMQAREESAQRVRSCIAVRNHRVLNLYASLGFRFSEPLMTFHWVRELRG